MPDLEISTLGLDTSVADADEFFVRRVADDPDVLRRITKANLVAALGIGMAGDTVTIAADTNNLALDSEEVIRISNTTGSSKNLTGIAGGAAGAIKRLACSGTAAIALVGESSSSTAANRFASSYLLEPGRVATIIYNGSSSRWEVFE